MSLYFVAVANFVSIYFIAPSFKSSKYKVNYECFMIW